MAALRAFLTCEYVPAPLSILGGVFKVLPGELLVATNRGVEHHRYWDMPHPLPVPSDRRGGR